MRMSSKRGLLRERDRLFSVLRDRGGPGDVPMVRMTWDDALPSLLVTMVTVLVDDDDIVVVKMNNVSLGEGGPHTNGRCRYVYYWGGGGLALVATVPSRQGYGP